MRYLKHWVWNEGIRNKKGCVNVIMKKIFFIFTMLCFISLTTISAASAADATFETSYLPKTCVVVIGESDVRSPDFTKFIGDEFNTKEAKNQVVYGTEIQSAYQNYWFQKGFLEEQNPQKQDLHDFVKFSSYDRCIFLIVSSPIMEKTHQAAGWFKKSVGGFMAIERTRASLEVKCFLVDKENVIKALAVTQNDDSKTSELRAKRGAFEKCMKELAKGFRTAIDN